MDIDPPKETKYFLELLKRKTGNNLFGPDYLQILKLNGRLILLFGDNHEKIEDFDNSALNIKDLILGLIKNIPACIDIFIEAAPYFVQGADNRDMYTLESKDRFDIPDYGLTQVIGEFWESFGNYKNPQTTYFNRVHNINPRYQPNKKYDLGKLPVWTSYEVYHNLILSLIIGDTYYMVDSLNYLFETDIYNAEDIKNESNLLKISKQYKDIPLKDKLIDEIIKDLDNHELSFDKKLLPKFRSMMSVRLAKKIMDVYALPRILKSIYVYDDSDIIIVYAGAAHTTYYTEKLLKIYDATLLYESEKNNDTYNNYKSSGMTDYEISQLINVDGYEGIPLRNHILLDENLINILINELLNISQKKNKCNFKTKRF